MSDSLRPHGLQPARLLCPWDSPGKNAGVGCPAVLQGILPTPGSNPHLLTSPALVSRFLTTSATWEALLLLRMQQKWQRFSSSFPTGKWAYFHCSSEYNNRMIIFRNEKKTLWGAIFLNNPQTLHPRIKYTMYQKNKCFTLQQGLFLEKI